MPPAASLFAAGGYIAPMRSHGWHILKDLRHFRRIHLIDLLVIAGVAGAVFGLFDVGREWTHELRQTVEIDLDSPWVLLRYTFFSLSRGLIAYVLSLTFSLVYGYWAAKDPVAERVLVPLLDILQSIPVLSFLPGLVLALVALFPSSNIGLELAAVLMIFTGQVWNMTFSFYHSLKAVPQEQREVATIFRFNWWQRLKWLELPFGTMGLVWNSMMSMAGGWFFLMINESFRLKDRDFRLPGIGSYMSVAVDEGRYDAMIWAILAMVAMIVLLDQLLWRPVVVWAQKFRQDDSGERIEMTSWFLRWLRRSRIIALLTGRFRRPAPAPAEIAAIDEPLSLPAKPATQGSWLSLLAFAVLLLFMLWGAWSMFKLLRPVAGETWSHIGAAALLTLLRVLCAVALGTLWTVPAGLAIGLSPRLSRALQPVIQVAASFPAPMLFPIVIVVLDFLHVDLNVGSIVLMLLGTQWYILFNVVAGAMAIPADLREAARSFRVSGWLRLWSFYLPAIFPYLVTGWVTAAGGAWNASIVSEYVMFRQQEHKAFGLGSWISLATEHGEFANLAAGTLAMSLLVVAFNGAVWRWLYRVADRRFSLNK